MKKSQIAIDCNLDKFHINLNWLMRFDVFRINDYTHS